MEGEVRGMRLERGLVASFSWALISVLSAFCFAHEKMPGGDQPEISLRKSVNSRRYQGRDVEGEERRKITMMLLTYQQTVQPKETEKKHNDPPVQPASQPNTQQVATSITAPRTGSVWRWLRGKK